MAGATNSRIITESLAIRVPTRNEAAGRKSIRQGNRINRIPCPFDRVSHIIKCIMMKPMKRGDPATRVQISARGHDAQSSSKKLPVWVFPGILVLIVVILNLNTLRNGLTYDDRTLLQSALPSAVQSATVLQPPAGLAPMGDYRPISGLSLSANKAVLGASPRAFHAVNIALHLVATLLVFMISTEILKGRMLGFTAALLFAIHPLHVESIQRIGQRGALLAGVAVIVALWLLMRSRSASLATSIGISATILVLYGVALLCSETALAFPGLWVLFALSWGHEASLRGRLRQMLLDFRFGGILALTVSYFLFCRAAAGRAFPFAAISYIDNPLAFVGAHARILTAIDVVRRCLILVVWPYRLSPEYSCDAVPLISSLWSPQFLMSATVLVALIAAAILFARKKPLYLFACMFFLISVSVVSNLLFPVGATMSEGLLYLPSLAICWALAQLLQDLGWISPDARQQEIPAARRFKPLAIVLVCLIVPWAAKTYLRNAEWQDDHVLYRAAVQTTPRSARSHFILGEVYFSEADFLGAEREYYRAVEIYPGYTEAANKLAVTRELLYKR